MSRSMRLLPWIVILLTAWASQTWAQKNLDGKVPEANTEPPGFKYGYFENPEKIKIRYGHIGPVEGTPAATIVWVGGMNEMIEKYFEAYRDMIKQGYQVYAMDWTGQAGSGRYAQDPQKTHAVDFEWRIRDLHQFVSEVVPNSSPGPKLLFAHSMGGNHVLRYLHDHPEVFDGLVVTAPLIDINTGSTPYLAVRVIARLGTWFGFSEHYAPGTGPWVMNPNYAPSDSRTSNHPERYAIHSDWYVIKPELQMGGPTIGWLKAAFDSIDIVSSPGYLENIPTRILMASPKVDGFVQAEKHAPVCKRLPNCRLVEYADSKHEPWMEVDHIRNAWLQEVLGFVENERKMYQARQKKQNAP